MLTFENNFNNEWSKLALGVNYRISADFEDRFIAKGNSGFSSFNSFPLDISQNPIIYDISEDQELSNYYDGEISELNFAFFWCLPRKIACWSWFKFL